MDTYESPRQLSADGATWYGFAIEPVKVTAEMANYFKLPGNWTTQRYAFVSAPSAASSRFLQSGVVTLINLDNGRTEGVLENPNPRLNAGFGTNVSFDSETNLMAVGAYGLDHAYLFDFANRRHVTLEHPDFSAYWGTKTAGKSGTEVDAQRTPIKEEFLRFFPEGTTANIVRRDGIFEVVVGGALSIYTEIKDFESRVGDSYVNIQRFDRSGNHRGTLVPPGSFKQGHNFCWEEPVPKSIIPFNKYLIWGSDKAHQESRSFGGNVYFTNYLDVSHVTTPVIKYGSKEKAYDKLQFGSVYDVYNDQIVIAFRGSEGALDSGEFGKLSFFGISPSGTPVLTREIFVGRKLERNIDITAMAFSGNLGLVVYRPLVGYKDYPNYPLKAVNVAKFGICHLETGEFVEIPEYQEDFAMSDGIRVIKFLPGDSDSFVYSLHQGIVENGNNRERERGVLRKISLDPKFRSSNGLLDSVQGGR